MDRFEQGSEPEIIGRYERLARKALALYGLEDAEVTGHVGARNMVFEVRHTRLHVGPVHYALRIGSRDASSDQLLRELLFLTALWQDGRRDVPEPILSRSGELIHSVSVPGVSGFRPVVLLRWMPGRAADAGQLSYDAASAIGRFIASIHQLGRTFRWPAELERPPEDETDLDALRFRLRALRGRAPDMEALIDRGVDLARRARMALAAAPSESVVIHGDMALANLRFTGETIRAFGFDRCRRGSRLDDLVEIDLALRRRDDGEPIRQALHAGYREGGDLPADAEAHLTASAAVRLLASLCDLGDVKHPAAVSRFSSLLARLRALLSASD